MPIIIDNFQVNTNAPIDNRFVVGPGLFYLTKDDINYKYVGLRVWDSNDNIPYYWDGTQWLSENSVGVIIDNTAAVGYLPKFTNGPTIIGKSLLFENVTSNQLGLGLVGNNINANHDNTTTQYGLHVAGNIKTNKYFLGDGQFINNINATNVTIGKMNIARIDKVQSLVAGTPIAPNTNYVLYNDGSNVTWKDSTTISVLNSENTNNVNVVSDIASTTTHYITFAQSTGNVPVKINSSKIQFKPSNGQLFLSNGSSTEPVYSFLGSTNTGMYFDGYNINFTNNGLNRVSIRPGGITIYDPNYTQIDFYKNPTDVQKLFVGVGGILKYRTNAWDPVDSVQIASDNIVWHSGNLYTLRNSGNLSIETGRNTNSQSTDASGAILKGVYTYNVYNSVITPSTQVHWSVVSFGKGDEGSIQLASNWYGNNTQNGLVYADRDILLRSLRDTVDDWSPWVKIWNSGNSGYVPFGAILMWSGSVNQIPTGWKLCDGNNGNSVSIPAGSVPGYPSITSITIPDLRERFVVGVGNNPGISKLDYSTTFTFTGKHGSTTTSTKTYTVNTTTSYWIDGTLASGILRTGNAPDGYKYHLYTTTGFYFIYDNRFKCYVLIQGTIPAVNATVTGTIIFANGQDGNFSNGRNPIEYSSGEYKDSYTTYTDIWTNGRRVAYLEIVWPTIQSSYSVGDMGGTNSIIMDNSQLPRHKHDATNGENYANNGVYGYVGSQNNSGAYDGDNYHYLTSPIGNNQPIENRPPYYALAFIIYTGI